MEIEEEDLKNPKEKQTVLTAFKKEKDMWEF